MNAVVVAVIVMLVLSLSRVHVVLSLTVGAFVGGLVAGMPLENIVDTAGRLQTKSNLMQELEKIYRVIGREVPGAPHETLLVLDAGTGQNAISQAELFSQVAPVTGVVLTKLDGTAKGGVTIGITAQLDIPIKWIGVGEGIDDLRPFHAEDFVNALFAKREDAEA